jgi:hypothetical protein
MRVAYKLLGTFNALFPIGNYFGVLADTGPGPQNFIDLNPRLQIQPVRNLSVSADLVRSGGRASTTESTRCLFFARPGQRQQSSLRRLSARSGSSLAD